MFRYFATFPAGTDSIIKKILLARSENSIENIYTNLVVFKSTIDYQNVSILPYFSNTFVLVTKFESANMQDLHEICRWAFERDTFITTLRKIIGNKKLFYRFRFFEGSKTISMSRELINDLISFVGSNTKLKYSSTAPELEITFIKRSEKISLVGIQFIEKKKYEPLPGELRPEIAFIMNYLSNPHAKDIFLDPFVGHGSLPISRLKNFPAQRIIVSDVKIALLNENLLRHGIKSTAFESTNNDGFSLSWLKDNSVTTIVTDPPWGRFTTLINAGNKYIHMFHQFARVLKDNGTCVILLPKDPRIEEILTFQKSLTLLEQHNVRIGGQSAIIAVLTKK